MRQCIVPQCHDFVDYRGSIQFHQGDASGTVVWILDRDAINGVLEAVSQTEARPIFRYDRIDHERVTAALESQDFFEPDAIGPSRGARVPRPATAPDVAGQRVNVPRYDVRLDLVAFAIILVPGVLDRIQHP